MRGQRARAAVTARINERIGPGGSLSEVEGQIERIGDDPAEWLAIAADLLSSGDGQPGRAALEACAALMSFALAQTSPHHRLRERFIQYYGAALATLGERHHDLLALNEAEATLPIEAERRSENDPFRHFLCYALERTAQLRKQLESGPQNGLSQAELGRSLMRRYQVSGGDDDLAAGIGALRQALRALPDDHPHAAEVSADLSAALSMLYRRNQDQETLSEAVQAGRAAVRLAGSDTKIQARALTNLGSSLLSWHTASQDGRVLDEAIMVKERALANTPDGDPLRSDRLNNLAEALYYSFTRTGDLEELDRSIALGRQAVAAHPPGSQHYGVLIRLSVRLHERYLYGNDLSALHEAVALAREIVRTIPEDNPDRPDFLAMAARVLRDLYDQAGQPELLEEIANIVRAGLKDLPGDDAARIALLEAKAAALHSEYRHTHELEAARESRELWLRVSRDSSTPRNKIISARLAAGLYVAEGKWADATQAYADAVGWLPMAASRRLLRADQEHQLDVLAGMVQDACASALQAGDPGRAVMMLEHGRGILFAQALDHRDDLTVLRDQHPELAGRLERIRDQLAGRGETPVPGDAFEVEEHHLLVSGWDSLVAEVRSLPGFGRFLLPPSIEQLLACAEQGPVVFFSISMIRSDALILTPDGVDVVELHGVTPDAVQQRALAFLDDVEQDGRQSRARHRVRETLEWLWDTFTAPVLDRLDMRGKPADAAPWPRIWWCPTGPLAFLPLHASGYHDSAQAAVPHTVIDRVISSYTPTVRALLHARRDRVADDSVLRSLVVAMPRTTGASNLPGAMSEVRIIRDRLAAEPTVLSGPAADRGRVLAELPAHEWVHFACHGRNDPGSPSLSHLLLSDHETGPLTVVDISRLNLDHAELAYLSACSTARVGTTLTDEAISLASAFQLAGYRNVVATMWPVADRPAVQFARDVYDFLPACGAASAARAVHHATRRLRSRWNDHPHLWAGHIHSGA